ncbi:AraC family transcriptional regulator [Mollicutes bacterium LVI A0039]|nr:AraC family transcriptional regulator [Mollicutes bacterium LVI A0039]
MDLKPIKIEQNSTILYNNLFDSKYEIGVRLQDFGTAFEEHYHNYIEIVCQLNSSSIQIINGQQYTLQAGDMVIIHPGDAHENVATESTVLNLIVSEKYLSNLVIDSTFDDSIIHIKNVVSAANTTQIYNMPKSTWQVINDIYYLMLSQSETTMYYLRQKINLASFFISLEDIEGIMNKSVSTNKWDVISYIENNLATASLNEYARNVNYSPSLVSQRVKNQYGISFVVILQELRLKHAARLLCTTNDNIEIVMAHVGYNNKTHFYNLFKEKFGKTPSSYRKANVQL